MVDNGSGVIINISSVNALGYYGNEAYSAAKAGLRNLTRSLAVRYGPSGIRVNSIAPGTLRTPAWEQRTEVDPDVFERIARWYPLGHVGKPGNVVGAASRRIPDPCPRRLAVRSCAPSDATRLSVGREPCREGRLARERGLGHLDFYHYGFCRLEALDWIRRAVA
jgi:NAD(P)-dependent dehydrogenase (short-subunit alcohol dehydrogenase family)